MHYAAVFASSYFALYVTCHLPKGSIKIYDEIYNINAKVFIYLFTLSLRYIYRNIYNNFIIIL